MVKYFKILNWRSANKLKDAKSVNFLMQIEYNLARVYLLSNWTYLVMPLNSYGNSLLTERQELVQKWIKERYFPAGDEIGKLYLDHREKMEDLTTHKEGLKNFMCEYIFGAQRSSDLCAWEIDDLYETLRKRKLLDRFKLHFTALLGDYILSRQEEADWRWGLLKTMQYLNPITSLILVPDTNSKKFYNLEAHISKRDFAGVDHHIKAFKKGTLSRMNESVEMIEVLEPTHILQCNH